jgi:hypothetical protein
VKKLVCVLAVLASLTAHRVARADSTDAAVGTAIAGGISIAAVTGAGSLVPLIGNSVTLGRHKPSRGWGIAGVVVGGLDVVGGALWLGLTSHYDFETAVGAPFVAVGAANILLGSVSLSLWNRERVSVLPVGGLDSTGRKMSGAAVRFRF